MDYLADTVAIVRHLRQHPRLGSQAATILKETDEGHHHVFLSPITLMEILYLSEAKRIDVQLANMMELIAKGSNYSVLPLDENIINVAATIDDVPELHDRVIVATAKYLDIPILTGDKVIERSRHIITIW